MVENGEMIVIGDVHCKVHEYQKMLHQYSGQRSIQVGDFGFYQEHLWHSQNVNPGQHKICFGNHDDQTFLDSPHSCGNTMYFGDLRLLTIRGAFSIDHSIMTTGLDWWPNEEMSYIEMNEAVGVYAELKPAIVVSHDCPGSIAKLFWGIDSNSITSKGLDAMFSIWKPELWIFGHHHKRVRENIDGTFFVGLKELEVYKLWNRT